MQEENEQKMYVYMGTYKYSTSCDIEHGYRSIRVQRNDKSAEYIRYCDIEKDYPDGEEIVLINEVSKFERNNIVLYPNRYLSYKYYEEIRKLFIETLSKSGKNKAIEKVLCYNNKN